jgi:uncharacterized membrane protein YcaP (DUF421 family)
VILVRDGKVIEEHLRRERFTRRDLQKAARAQGFSDLADVTLAVLEEDGSMSFIGEKP